MYDMYPWDSASQGDYPAKPSAESRRAPPRRPRPESAPPRAVQVALDRRDNGGDAVAGRRPPTPPTAGRTRQ